MTKSYSVGRNGLLKRLDNLSGTWIDLSTNTPKVTLNDVMTEPGNPDKVFIVGNQGVILVSSDGGVTLNIPSGFYPADINYYEVWCVDSDVIYACGQEGVVVKSTDGGLTFNTTLTFPTDDGLRNSKFNTDSIHFLTPLLGVTGISCQGAIIGTGSFAYITTDGGDSWSILNSGNELDIRDVPRTPSIFLSNNGNNIVVNTLGQILTSPAPFTTFSTVFTWSSPLGAHITKNFNQLWGFSLEGERIYSNNFGTSWNVIAPLTPGNLHWGGHFYDADAGFFTQNKILYASNALGTSDVVSDSLLTFTQDPFRAVWTEVFNPTCYLLLNCQNEEVIQSNSDLSEVVGQVVTIEGESGCFLVEINDSEECDNPVDVEVIESYFTCEDCIPYSFRLTDCNNPENIIYTNQDLNSYTEQIVQLSYCSNCWLVERVDRVEIESQVSIRAIFETCEDCLPEQEEEIRQLVRLRQVQPGYNPKSCTPEYYDKVSCNFAEAAYTKMAEKKYGIKICCEQDFDKWYIKHELMHVEALYDFTLCQTQVVYDTCCPPCNVSAELVVHDPIILCVPPDNVEAFIILNDSPSLPPMLDNSEEREPIRREPIIEL